MNMKWFGYVLAAILSIGMSASFISTSYAVGTPAGTVVENIATVNYKDDNSNSLPSVSSDPATARTVISQVYGVDVAPSSATGSALAGATAHYSVTVTNTGNGDDTFNLAVPAITCFNHQ